jgi:DNA-directed RNA polymerase subunit RPC12/RpoP
MAEKGKSKTNVSARAESKARVNRCSYCGNKIEVVMAVSPTGKKKIKRVCCEG